MAFGKFRDDDDKGSSTTSGSSSSSFGGVSTGKSEAFLGKGSKVVGSLVFNGPVELDGTIEGEIHAKDSLTIGESAIISGKVFGADINVRGTVNGDIVASKKLSFRKPARVIGNISCPNLSMEEGVHFEGKCAMTSLATNVSEIKPVAKPLDKTAAA